MRSSKVFLVRPVQSAEAAFPLELAAVGAALLGRGFEVEAIDLAIDRRAVRRLVQESSPGVTVYISTTTVGVSTYPNDWPHVETLARTVKEASNAHVVVGGTYANLDPKRCSASRFVDAVVQGEPEVALPVYLAAGGGPGEVRGPSLAHDLDALPYPELSLLDIRAYRTPAFARSSLAAPLVTSRGCHHRCGICTRPIENQGLYRRRSPESVLGEMRQRIAIHGVTHFVIEDDLFTNERRHVVEVCEQIIDTRLGVSWECLNGLRVDTLDVDLLRLMHRAGCTHIALGVETFDVDLAARVGRPYSEEHLRALLDECQELGVRTTGYFVLGLEGQPALGAYGTVRRARALSFDVVHFNLFVDPSASRPPRPRFRDQAARAALYAYAYATPHRIATLLSAGALAPRKWPKIASKLLSLAKRST